MAKREPVTMYFSEEEKEQIKKEAAAEGKPVSAYCRDIIQEHRFERTAEDIDAEERLERVFTEGVERMERIAENVEQQNGVILHVLREIEADLEGVDVDVDESPGDDFHDRISDDNDGGGGI